MEAIPGGHNGTVAAVESHYSHGTAAPLARCSASRYLCACRNERERINSVWQRSAAAFIQRRRKRGDEARSRGDTWQKLLNALYRCRPVIFPFGCLGMTPDGTERSVGRRVTMRVVLRSSNFLLRPLSQRFPKCCAIPARAISWGFRGPGRSSANFQTLATTAASSSATFSEQTI